jgi:YHS domain-containing protein
MTNDESRMVKDPICGKDVDTLRARAVAIFGGVTYYFCSQECKAKFQDPRGSVGGEAPVPERRKTATATAAATAVETATGEAADELPVRYARSRMRRITGEVSTPVVQIDLSSKKPDENDPMDTPARSGRGWVLLAVVMLIIAGGVILFTLKDR